MRKIRLFDSMMGGYLKKGYEIFIDDGNIALVAKSTSKNRIEAEVIMPGILKNNKGVNIPGIRLKFKDMK